MRSDAEDVGRNQKRITGLAEKSGPDLGLRIKNSALWILDLSFEKLPFSVRELRRELAEGGYLLTGPAKGCAFTIEKGRWTDDDAIGTSAVFYLQKTSGLYTRHLATLRFVVVADGSIQAVHDIGKYVRRFSSTPSDEDVAATLHDFVRDGLPGFLPPDE
ncbi:hypothetical protein [Sabulicella rubraurantiaca]|uniref:hypothetical protein n=1 Tax=Sabulicella rubraurantiaca TaxID=2811429 RepID=UPI001A97B96D|nr:hypothetical protein [Sabulicella rubraurantiaca]